jgi:hypothetical protein
MIVVARTEPTGRREAPPNDRLREIAGPLVLVAPAPDCAALHPGYQFLPRVIAEFAVGSDVDCRAPLMQKAPPGGGAFIAANR